MNILAIDTSNLPLSLAVMNEGKVLGEWTTNVEKNHSLRLMPLIQALLKEVNLTPNQLDLIAVAQGPGSYTGVRIGVTTAKSLAWSLQKPLVGVSSLISLAHQVPFFDGVIVPMFDARRKRVYTGGYAWECGQLNTVIPEQVIHIEELVKQLENKKALFIGNDVVLHQEFLSEYLGENAYFLTPAYQLPRAAHIAQLGLQRYREGKVENYAFAPQYLQPTEAEARLGE